MIAITVLVAVRVVWYCAVAVGVPFVPPRDDQAAREAVIEAIQKHSLPESTDAAGDTVIVLPMGWADLASGGSVVVVQEEPLVAAFIAHQGFGGRFDGWVYVATGSRALLGAVGEVEPVAPDWFYVYTY